MATTLEIITGINQAAANAYDGSHDERFVTGDAKKVGLGREEGCPIVDSRVSDGFGVKIVGDMLQINYESNVSLSSVYAAGFEEECERKLQQIADFLKKEYKVITGKSLSITPQGEAQCLVQNTSRVRTFVTAHKMYKIGGMKQVTTLGEAVTDSMAVNYHKFLKEGGFAKKKVDEVFGSVTPTSSGRGRQPRRFDSDSEYEDSSAISIPPGNLAISSKDMAQLEAVLGDRFFENPIAQKFMSYEDSELAALEGRKVTGAITNSEGGKTRVNLTIYGGPEDIQEFFDFLRT